MFGSCGCGEQLVQKLGAWRQTGFVSKTFYEITFHHPAVKRTKYVEVSKGRLQRPVGL